jgi:16S rRNA processing protein RimM
LLRARGNKGELAAISLTSQPDRLKNVFVNQVPMEVERTWMHGDHLIFKFKGVDPISDAERLAGADVAIPMEERPQVAEGEYYQSDLVGCEVFDGVRFLGTVAGWQETGGPVLVEVKTVQGKELLIPFAKAIFTKIDLEQRRIDVKLPDGLLDLN